MNNLRQIAVSAVLLTASFAAESSTNIMIGFRYDGTGVFPPDCNPPTEFDGITGKNLKWKVPLPNHGNGSPIVVNGKVFVVCAAGWPEGVDCATLLCFDAETGKELWRREMDEFATFPPERAAKAREIRKEYYSRIRRLNRMMDAWQRADQEQQNKIRAEAQALSADLGSSFLNNKFRNFSAEGQMFHSGDFSRNLREICGYSPIMWGPTCMGVDMPTPVSDGTRVFVTSGRRSVYAFDLNGTLLWQTYQEGVPEDINWVEDCGNSPILVDGILLIHIFQNLWAYDSLSGRLLWKVPQPAIYRHGMGTPVVLRIPRYEDAKIRDAMVYTWIGDLIRVRDGKVMISNLLSSSVGAITSNGGSIIFLSSPSTRHREFSIYARNSRGHPKIPFNQDGTWAIAFVAEPDDKIAWSVRWHNLQVQLDAYPIYQDRKIYLLDGRSLNVRDGSLFQSNPSKDKVGYHGSILAGGTMYGQLEAKNTEIAKDDRFLRGSEVRAGVRELGGKVVSVFRLEVLDAEFLEESQGQKVIAMTGYRFPRPYYGWYPASACPFAAGKALFFRTFDGLWCFAEKIDSTKKQPQ